MTSFILTLLFSLHAGATEVAFLQAQRPDGSLYQLEPGGRFFHAAIRVGQQWLHAHPSKGVELVNNLAAFGDSFFILQNPQGPDPSVSQLENLLGKPFDFTYSWDNPLATYCTRLIAELLAIPPQVMRFQAPIWKDHTGHSPGSLGLSPDDLFVALVRLGFRPLRTCTIALSTRH